MSLPEAGYVQPVEIVVGGALPRSGWVQPVDIVGTGVSMAIGGLVVGGTPGSVLFVDAAGNLGQNNASFFWDNTKSILKATNAQFKGSPWFDIKAFGAVGDGVTDDSAAIQAAINAAIATSGGVVYVPIGTYAYATGLTTGTNKDICLMGAGKGISVLAYTGAGVAVQFGTVGSSVANARVGAKDLTVTSTGTKAISFAEVQEFYLERVRATCTSGTGIEFLGSNSGLVSDTDAMSSTIGVDYVTSSAKNANLITWIGGQITLNATAVRALGTSFGNTLKGINIASNTASPAVVVQAAKNWVFDSDWFENNAGGANTYSIQLGSVAPALPGTGCIFRGNFFQENNSVTYGIRVLNAESTLSEGNYFSSGLTALVRCESNALRTVCFADKSIGAGGTLLSDASVNSDTLAMGPQTNFFKDVNGYNISPIVDASLTASRLMASDANKVLSSVANLSTWILGTANQITVTDNGSGAVTLATPQSIGTGSSPTFTGLTLSGLTQGSIPFAGAGGVISQHNSQLFWNDTTGRVGILTASPQRALHIASAAAARMATSGGEGIEILQQTTATWGISIIGSTTTSFSLLPASGGGIGINTNTPRRFLDVLDASNPQIRFSQADNSMYGEWQANSSGDAILTSVSKYCILPANTSAVTSSHQGNSSISFWLDEGGNNLKVQVKYSGGTVKTATIAVI